MPSKKWTYDRCKEVALEFTSLKDFRSKYPSAYTVAKKNNWIVEYTWLSIGRNAGFWTYERCYNEAKKYKTVSEFAKGCGGAHFRAKQNNWIKDYDWFIDGKKLSSVKRVIWDYDTCYNLALECKSKSELKRKNNRAYNVARINGWFKNYTWFTPEEEIRHKKRPSRVKWTYDLCRIEALKYKTRGEFSKGSPSAYTISNRNRWIDDFDWLDRSENIYVQNADNVYAYIFTELKSVYIGRTINISERHLGHTTNEKSTVYRFSIENNIPIPNMTILESGLSIIEGLEKEDFYRKLYEAEGWNVLNIAKTGIKSGSLGGLGSGKWTKRTCYREAKKYKTMKDFRTTSPSAYNVACKYGWQNDYVWLKQPKHKRGYWTYERCYEEAKKYKTRTEFQKGSGSAYDKSLKEHWIDDYDWFAPSSNLFKWDYDACYTEAKKYTKLSDFIKNCGRAYKISRDNNWIESFTWLIKKDISKKAVLQYSLDGEFIAKYNGVRDAVRALGLKSNSSISLCCNGKLKSAYGYIWKYAED